VPSASSASAPLFMLRDFRELKFVWGTAKSEYEISYEETSDAEENIQREEKATNRPNMKHVKGVEQAENYHFLIIFLRSARTSQAKLRCRVFSRRICLGKAGERNMKSWEIGVG
jgi:hypothetical protein